MIVSAHSGADTSSSYGDALPYTENAASLVAAGSQLLNSDTVAEDREGRVRGARPA